MLSPRCYQITRAMRLLAEARIGRAVTIQNAELMREALLVESRRAEPGHEVLPSDGRRLDAPAILSAEDVAVSPVAVSLRVAGILANGRRPPRIMLAAAVTELNRLMQDDSDLSSELRRLQTDVLCGRASEENVL